MNLAPPQNNENQLEECRNVCQGIKSAINDLGPSVLAPSDVWVSFVFEASSPELTTGHGISGESRRPTKCSGRGGYL